MMPVAKSSINCKVLVNSEQQNMEINGEGMRSPTSFNDISKSDIDRMVIDPTMEFVRPPSPFRMYINYYKRVNSNVEDAKSLGQQCGASWAKLNVDLKTYFIDQAAEKKIEYYKVMEKKEAYDNACEIMKQKTKAAYFESRERFKKSVSTSESSPEMSTSASESAQEMSTSASESAQEMSTSASESA
ncbi:hypothetical protein L1887_03255 [Cichorium endivia]|nr:hypothetical protein L1887_03255 [Cichorium endivia]